MTTEKMLRRQLHWMALPRKFWGSLFLLILLNLGIPLLLVAYEYLSGFE